MKTINIRTDDATLNVPAIISFQGAPHDNFAYGEEVFVQLVNNDGEKIGQPEIRSVVKTHDADENERAWYDAYVPMKRD